jgi:hypothetical protein
VSDRTENAAETPETLTNLVPTNPVPLIVKDPPGAALISVPVKVIVGASPLLVIAVAPLRTISTGYSAARGAGIFVTYK